MEKPNGLSWEHTKNDKGIDMATLNRQSLVDFMLYAEHIQQEHDRMKEGIKWVLDEYIECVNDSDEITEKLETLLQLPTEDNT